jgi:hypothetical protein
VVRNESIEAKILELFELFKQVTASIPRDIGYPWEGGWSVADRPILFLDAIGRDMLLPLNFCIDQDVSGSCSILTE